MWIDSCNDVEVKNENINIWDEEHWKEYCW